MRYSRACIIERNFCFFLGRNVSYQIWKLLVRNCSSVSSNLTLLRHLSPANETSSRSGRRAEPNLGHYELSSRERILVSTAARESSWEEKYENLYVNGRSTTIAKFFSSLSWSRGEEKKRVYILYAATVSRGDTNEKFFETFGKTFVRKKRLNTLKIHSEETAENASFPPPFISFWVGKIWGLKVCTVLKTMHFSLLEMRATFF